MTRRLDAASADFAAQFDALLNAKREVDDDVEIEPRLAGLLGFDQT